MLSIPANRTKPFKFLFLISFVEFTLKPSNFYPVALMLGVVSAHASTVEFAGSSTAAFGAYQPAVTVSRVVNSAGQGNFADQNEFSWGGRAAANRSALSFDGLSFNAGIAPFVVGSLTYLNNKILAEQALNSVAFSLGLDFGAYGRQQLDFDFAIDETADNVCSEPGCPDTVTIAPRTSFTSLPLATIDNVSYRFEFLGFAVGGQAISPSFTAGETASSVVNLYGRMTATPVAVPIPAVLTMFVTGLLGVLGMGTRSKIR